MISFIRTLNKKGPITDPWVTPDVMGSRGVPRIWQGGGGQEIFFFRFGNLHVAKRHAAHGEASGACPPEKIF